MYNYCLRYSSVSKKPCCTRCVCVWGGGRDIYFNPRQFNCWKIMFFWITKKKIALKQGCVDFFYPLYMAKPAAFGVDAIHACPRNTHLKSPQACLTPPSIYKVFVYRGPFSFEWKQFDESYFHDFLSSPLYHQHLTPRHKTHENICATANIPSFNSLNENGVN